MRKILLGFSFVLCFSTVFAQKSYETLFNQPQSDVYEITFNVKDYALVEATFDGVTYQTIDMGVSTTTMEKGWAELPFISASIELPALKDVDFNVVYTDYVDIQLEYPLLPSRGSITRNQDPSQIPYEINPASLVDEFYPQQMCIMEDPFIYREVRGTTVRIFPFQYNAVTGTLRMYRSVRVELVENNNPPTNPFLRERVSNIREVEGIYKDLFLNYDATKLSATLTMQDYGDILVITTSAFEATMASYIQWKREMGYNVTLTIVANATNVTSTILSAYNANPNLMYVQLAGDWANIKSPTITSDAVSCPIDPFMGAVSGSDNYLDIAVGRFSCATTADLLIQINKAITYEKTPDMTAGWRETFIGIGSSEGSGIGDDSEIDYTHIQRIFTSRLDPFTYNTHRQNYDPGASATTLAGHINTGASTIAYCGHGDVDQFVTTGFDNADVNSLTNGNKLPFIVSVACVNGTFQNSAQCFAEYWLRKSGGGAVVTLMSTINQDWQPPQRGQDYFYDILIGGFNYDTDGISGTTGYNTTEQRTHWGSIVVNAFVLMLTQSSGATDVETIKTWTTFGDASLQLRTKVPAALTLSNSSPEVGVAFTGTASIAGVPAKNVLICISAGGSYYSGLTNASGVYNITHSLSAGSALLVATAFNSTTVYSTVTVIDADPCAAVNSFSATSAGTTATLTWTVPSDGVVTGYKVYCDGVLQTTTTALTYSQNSLANGSYDYCVAAVYGTDECYMQECGTVLINDGSSSDCDSPTNLAIDEVSSTVHNLTWTAPELPNAYFDDIESHSAFTINSAGTVPWTFIDGDATTTFSISNYAFTNNGLAMASIVFDPNLVLHTTNSTPLSQTTDGTPFTAHSGDQFFACFNSASAQTNDWIVSPQLTFTAPFEFSFFARSGHKVAYPESFRVAYSTTTNAQASFTNVVATVASVPFAWTEYSYTIPANAKYVAINCNSNDMYYFCVDDIYIGDGSMPGAGLTGYNVYCDNSYLGTTTTTTFTNAEATAGNHEYCVEAVYDNACISPQICANIGVVLPTYTITASSGTNGTVTPAGSSTVNEGTNKTYTITPASCYQVANVLVDGVSVGAVSSYTFTNVTANHTISATFSQISYTVSVNAGAHGSVSGVGATATCGSSITFTVLPDACYSVATATVNGTAVTLTSNSYTISNVSSNISIVITYALTSYTVTTNAVTGGTITGAGSSANCGSSVTFSVNPDACYTIGNVTVNGTPVTLTGNSYTINNVSANVAIAATFVQTVYSVLTNVGFGGSISGLGSTVGCGDDLTFTITPIDCYEIGTLTVNGVAVSPTDNSYTIDNVSEDIVIAATFVENEITIVASAGAGGSISPSGNVSATCGGNKLFTITPDENYIILAVYVDGVSQGAPTAYMFTNIIDDATINAEFEFQSGLTTNDLNSEVSLFPNPATDNFELYINSQVEDYTQIQIVSIDGKIVLEQDIVSDRMSFDISGFADGVYFVKLNGNSKSVSLKLNKM